jgi:hypothetical protein
MPNLGGREDGRFKGGSMPGLKKGMPLNMLISATDEVSTLFDPNKY